MESNLTSLNFSILNISFVSNQANWYIRTYLSKVLIPFSYVSIGISRCEIKHNNSTIGINVITFSKFSKFLLSSCVPNIKGNFTKIGIKHNSGNLSTFCWDIWFLEVTSIMSFSKGSFSNTTISYKNEFKFSSDIRR